MKALVRISDLEIMAIAADSASFGIDLSNPAMEVQIPEDMDPNCIEASMEGDVIVLSENSVSIQSRRNSKLNELRSKRAEKLKKVDLMVNELILELRSDKAAIVEYRQELLDVTETYKKVNGDAKAIIDGLDLDDASIWPEEI